MSRAHASQIARSDSTQVRRRGERRGDGSQTASQCECDLSDSVPSSAVAHRMRPEGCPGGNIVMDSQIDQADFEQLLSRLSEGGLDASERKRLGVLIESDQTRRQLYLKYCQI